MVLRKGYVSEIFASFQGEGARVGERHLFVRLAGCNIRCRYCDTPDSLERTARCRIDTGESVEWRDNPLSSADLRSLIETRIAAEPYLDAVAITGGEPLVQAGFLAQVLGSQPLGVPVLLETNGVLPKRLAQVVDRIDVVSMDIKPPSNTGEEPFWQEHAEFLKLAASRSLYVKILVDRGTAAAEISRAAQLVAENAPAADVFLQPVTRPDGSVDIDAATLARFHGVARAQHARIRIVPQTHKMMRVP